MKTKSPGLFHMLVTVPRLPDLTPAEQRRSVRDTLKQTGDYWGRRVVVRSAIAGVRENSNG